MKKQFLLAVMVFFFLACKEEKPKHQFLVKIYEGDFINENARIAYLSDTGDTIIPYGKYIKAYTDTIKTWGIVQKRDGQFIAIDPVENVLFEVYNANDKPDEIRSGLFRVIVDGKIGYANAEGTIVIPAQYECAFPFFNGKARVALNCKEISGSQGSDEWFFIDNKGQKLSPESLK